MNSRSQASWRSLRLGIFFLLSTVILTTALFIVGTNQKMFSRKYELKIRMTNTQGLAKGGMVSLSGIEVGRVTDLQIVHGDTAHVIEFDLSVERGYQERITKSSLATIRTVGVLGDKFIDISMGVPGEPPLEEGAVVPVRPTVDWAATLERGVTAMDDMIVLVDEASEVVARINRGEGALGVLVEDPETAGRLRRLVVDLSAVGDELNRGRGSLGRLLHSPDAARDLEAILARLDRITTATEEGSGLLGRLIYDEDLGARMDRMLSDTDSLITAIGGDGTTGRLIQDEALYEQLRTALEDLQRLVLDFRENPERYVRVSIF